MEAAASSSLFVVNTWHTRVISSLRLPSQVSFLASQRKNGLLCTDDLLADWLAGSTVWLSLIYDVVVTAEQFVIVVACDSSWEPTNTTELKVLYSFALVPVFSHLSRKATTGWGQLRSPLAVGVWLMFDWPRCVFRWGPLALSYIIKNNNYFSLVLVYEFTIAEVLWMNSFPLALYSPSQQQYKKPGVWPFYWQFQPDIC